LNIVGGSQNYGGADIIPSFEEVVATEDPYEDWYDEGHAFVQHGSRVINIDL